MLFKEDSENFMDFDKTISSLEHRYCEERIPNSGKEKGRILAMTPL